MKHAIAFALICAGCATPSSTTTQSTSSTAAATNAGNETTSAQVARQVEGEMSALAVAPRQLVAKARLNAPIEEVWAYISNHDNLVEYSAGILASADIDRSGADEPNGVGTTRECSVGEDRFIERVVFFEAPYAFAYSAFENSWGMRDHLGTVLLVPDGDGIIIEWGQHFQDMPQPEMTQMMSQNISGMLNGRMLPFLTGRFGGEVLTAQTMAAR